MYQGMFCLVHSHTLSVCDQQSCDVVLSNLVIVEPKRPRARSKIVNRTVSALNLQIQHPAEGQFDSFEINYKLRQHNEIVFVNRSSGNTTVVELSPLEPGTCYNISVYTVSNSEKSAKPRMIWNECLRKSNNRNVIVTSYVIKRLYNVQSNHKS